MTGDELRAACADHDPELFFPLGEFGRPGPQPKHDPEVERARAVCARCPLREPCLQGALERGERYGIWGGLTTPQRDRLDQPERVRPKPGPKNDLSETAVMRMVAKGYTDAEIAQTLRSTPRAVQRIRAAVREREQEAPDGWTLERARAAHAAYAKCQYDNVEPDPQVVEGEKVYRRLQKRQQRSAGTAA